jgi:deferrochelatase/peroxidase EfeB
MKFAAGWPKYDSDGAMMRSDIDGGDIQAIAKTAFDSLKSASYLLLRVVDPPAARRWLRGLAPARLADVGRGKKKVTQTSQIAFTAAGLLALGVDKAIVGRFSLEFVEGMAGDENRSRRLGDIGANAPANWQWGFGDREPHVLLMLFSADADNHARFVKSMLEQAESSGLSKIDIRPTSDMEGLEPFGFSDGISQPAFDWDRPRTPGTRADLDYTAQVALGELLLGHRNEYGLLTERPWLAADEKNAGVLRERMLPSGRRDLGLNGSYLVYRELAQDVRGFWRWVAREAERLGVAMEELAEAMVGRRRNGTPLANLTLARSIAGIDADGADLNDFLYDTDPDGLSCPIGAHIRRANPRSGDAPAGQWSPLDRFLIMLGLTTRRIPDVTSSTLPWPRNTTVWPFVRSNDDAVASARFHRILRRGREYGAKLDPEQALASAAPDPEAGIQFICLNANIARQFEFVQSAWLASPKFAALSGEQDPLLGNREPFPTAPLAQPQRSDAFSRPGAPPNCRYSTGLPQFITVRGGSYFFLPGLTALKWIASD